MTSFKESTLYPICQWFARPALTFYLLPWLLVILVLGTVAQRYLGLYHSEKLFFGSFFIWIGPIPLPGAYITLSLLAVSLCAKLLLKSSLKSKGRSGTLVVHASVLLLLLGGLISSLTREEGYITLLPRQNKQAVEDYHDRTLTVVKNKIPVAQFSYDSLRKGMSLPVNNLPFKVTIRSHCYPCAPKNLIMPLKGNFGMANVIELVQALPNADDGLNHAGAMVEISSEKKEINGQYAVLEQFIDPTPILIGDDRYTIEMRAQERPLPFSVELVHFEQENHPGTDMAREYRSELLLKDGAVQWKAQVSMNEPLRYRGYTLYQSSFIEMDGKTASVLAVVRNAGWLIPYVSIALLSAGLLAHLLLRRTIRTATMLVLFVSFFAVMPQAFAEERHNFSYEDFGGIPVLHEGRVKPLDSFARALLKGMSGEQHIEGYQASVWLAQVLFSSQDAMQQPVFLVKSPQLIQMLSLPSMAHGRYTFNDLIPRLSAQQTTIETLLKREPKNLSDAERELLHLYEMVSNFAKLSGSLSLLSPIENISGTLRKELALPEDEIVSFYSVQKKRHQLMEKLKNVVEKKKNDIERYTPLEQDMARLAFHLDKLEQVQQGNALFRVMPGEWDNKEEWLSPWLIITKGAGSPQAQKRFIQWRELALAWEKGSTTSWKSVSASLREDLSSLPSVRPSALALEILYNQSSPLNKVMLLYVSGVILSLLALAFPNRLIRQTSFLFVMSGAIIHALAVVARMIILMRPPVSTLYESMLFVGFVSSVMGIIYTIKRKHIEALLSGALVGAAVLYLATIFSGDGDTLEMLTAVLNTNFWLATHVVCITAGYGFSLLTGVYAHMYLLRKAVSAESSALVAQMRLLHTLALFALFFTITGTMLGGIWADQSWGRFWGWDPKENGALAIVIWLTWALHGRLSGHLRETGFALVLALTTIVVALAWVGVNLLSVGLHSYGFSSAAAWGLPVFCCGELVIVAMLAIISANQSKMHGREQV